MATTRQLPSLGRHSPDIIGVEQRRRADTLPCQEIVSAMAAMQIVHSPHPALRHPAKPVACIDKSLQLHIGKIMELMYEAKGLGLAAPQVALPYQLLVMNITGDPAKPESEEVYVNPAIVERKGIVDDEEGCLS